MAHDRIHLKLLLGANQLSGSKNKKTFTVYGVNICQFRREAYIWLGQ